MKKFALVSAAAVALCSAAGIAFADGQVELTAAPSPYNGLGNSGGGVVINNVSGYNGTVTGLGFSTETATGTRGLGSFVSFCIEHDENVNVPGGPYYSVISDRAVQGGTNVPPGTFDMLDPQTAALYIAFQNGTNFGGTIGVIDSNAETENLQRAIWQIEGETGGGSNAQSDEFVAWAVAHSDGEVHNVRVLQLWSSATDRSEGARRQDFLTMVPLPPSAYAGMGTMAGLLGLGYIRRRRLAVA